MVLECIKVSDFSKNKIDKRKQEESHSTRDSAVRSIISESEMYREMKKKKRYFTCERCKWYYDARCMEFDIDSRELWENGIDFLGCSKFIKSE